MTGVPLFDAWDEVAARLAAPAVWLGTDFDGTLAPDADDPFAVSLPAGLHDRIVTIAARPGLAVAVISGRSLADLIPRVGISGLAYAGNHGLEIDAPGFRHTDQHALATLADLHSFAAAITPMVARCPGAFLEDKRLTLELHTRLATPESRVWLRTVVDEHLPKTLLARHLELGSEIRPAKAGNKGTAAIALRDHQLGPDALPVFLGDHETDEDAFTALPEGLTIKVGPGPTAARYSVDTPADVFEFFERLYELVVDRPRPV